MPKRNFACLFLLSLLLNTGTTMTIAAEAPLLSEPDQLKLSQLETKFFGHTYKKESEQTRLNRLETFVFGSAAETPVSHARLIAMVRSTHFDDSTQPVSVPIAGPPKGVSPGTLAAMRQSQANSIKVVPKADRYQALYPRVTQIEQLLLGQSFESDKLEARLDRIEINTFGKRSVFPDTGSRVDFLADYSRAFHPAAYRNQEPEILNVAYEPQTVQRTQQFFGVVDQIEMLEKNVYGTIHPKKTLQHRVEALEESIYGKTSVRNEDELTSRVSRLWVTLKASANSNRRST